MKSVIDLQKKLLPDLLAIMQKRLSYSSIHWFYGASGKKKSGSHILV